MLDQTPIAAPRDWTAIKPRDTPYPAPLFLYHFVRNPLRCLPRAVYEEPIVPHRIGRFRTAWVMDPELTETVFLGRHAQFPKPPLEQRVFSDPLGQSILTSQGADWRWQRGAVAGLFRHEDILSYTPDMAGAASALLDGWRQQRGRRTRPIHRDVTQATYAAISRTLFGGAAMPEAAEIQAAVDGYLNATSWEIAAALAGMPAWGWHPGRGPMKRSSRAMRAAITRMLDRWQAQNGAQNGTRDGSRDGSRDGPQNGAPGGTGAGTGGDHLFARLLAAEEPGRDGGGISRERVLNNLLTFLNAGHETTAKALIWTLFILAQEPEWQDRLRDEAQSVIGDGPVEGHHVEDLVLTRQVFEEAMRLYAPAPVLTRLATEDCDLGGVELAAGSVIFIPIWAVHRHRALWPEPEQFRPERFAPSARKAIRRTQFMPFGFGPRICIGATFSRVEGVAMLATLLRGARFDWPGGPPPEPLARVTLWPRGGMTLGVTPI